MGARGVLGCALVLLMGFEWVQSHGRLRDPPSRSSAWRDGFDTPKNWNDNELSCGGVGMRKRGMSFQTQANNGGKCGICGDAWNLPEPRPNELGGTYGQGVITREYKKGQAIDTWIQLTSNHLGWYELKLCPLESKTTNKDATQQCLDGHVLQAADGSGPKIHVPMGVFDFRPKMKLPDDVTCEHCVIQWHYRTGNRWGICEDGTGALGCGPQEIFRGCADVSISP